MSTIHRYCDENSHYYVTVKIKNDTIKIYKGDEVDEDNLYDTIKQINDVAFNPSIKNSSAPLVLLLHFVNLPPGDINTYLSKVVKALQILQPKLLTGPFLGGQLLRAHLTQRELCDLRRAHHQPR